MALGVGPGRHDADRLSFEYGKCDSAEIEHDVPDIARRSIAGQRVNAVTVATPTRRAYTG
jgi:hypothetical protein